MEGNLSAADIMAMTKNNDDGYMNGIWSNPFVYLIWMWALRSFGGWGSNAAEQGALGFTTLIQVNNSCCSVNNNQTLTFVATAATAGSITHANLAIIRL